MANRIFTFGYEGLSADEFIRRLNAAGVGTVVDVRANPVSRKPGFSKQALANSLKASGIAYIHVPALGCPKPVRERYKRDADWVAYTRGFLAYLKGKDESVAEIIAIARRSPSCLICFEADFNRCHRTYVAHAAAEQGGFDVVHLTDRKELADAAVRSAA